MEPDLTIDLPDDQPFLMLNALWYKPDGGREQYTEYLKAAQPFTDKHGGKAINICVPQHAIYGEMDADILFFVQWPSWIAFQEFHKDTGYNAIKHLRGDAITKSLLIRCKPIG